MTQITRLAWRPDDLATAIRLDPSFIRKLVHRGVIPRLPHTGRAILIPAWAVDAYIATGNWPTTPPTTATEPAAVTAGP